MKFQVSALLAALSSSASLSWASPLPSSDNSKSSPLEKRTTTFKPNNDNPLYSGLNHHYQMNYTGACPDRDDVSWYRGVYLREVSSGGTTHYYSDVYDHYYGPGFSYYHGGGYCNLFSQGYTSTCGNGAKTSYTDPSKGAGYKYYDCLLQRTVFQYSHPQIGKTVVYWTLGSWDMYRFYDNRNFAWFVGCPTSSSAKLRARENLEKRGGGYNGINPDWDFRDPASVESFVDTIPMSNYATGWDTSNTVSGLMWWSSNSYTLDGNSDCQYFAASRPGLLHPTCVFDKTLAPNYE